MALELSKSMLKQAFKKRYVETSFSQEEIKSTERNPHSVSHRELSKLAFNRFSISVQYLHFSTSAIIIHCIEDLCDCGLESCMGNSLIRNIVKPKDILALTVFVFQMNYHK